MRKTKNTYLNFSTPTEYRKWWYCGKVNRDGKLLVKQNGVFRTCSVICATLNVRRMRKIHKMNGREINDRKYARDCSLNSFKCSTHGTWR